MRASIQIVSGSFFGAEIEPGTFHQEVAAGTPDRVNQRETNAADTSPEIPQPEATITRN